MGGRKASSAKNISKADAEGVCVWCLIASVQCELYLCIKTTYIAHSPCIWFDLSNGWASKVQRQRELRAPPYPRSKTDYGEYRWEHQSAYQYVNAFKINKCGVRWMMWGKELSSITNTQSSSISNISMFNEDADNHLPKSELDIRCIAFSTKLPTLSYGE